MQFYQKIPIINKGRHLFRRLFFISHGHIKNEAEKIDVNRRTYEWQSNQKKAVNTTSKTQNPSRSIKQAEVRTAKTATIKRDIIKRIPRAVEFFDSPGFCIQQEFSYVCHEFRALILY